MVIELGNTLVTHGTVLGADWTTDDAGAAELAHVKLGRLSQLNDGLEQNNIGMKGQIIQCGVL